MSTSNKTTELHCYQWRNLHTTVTRMRQPNCHHSTPTMASNLKHIEKLYQSRDGHKHLRSLSTNPRVYMNNYPRKSLLYRCRHQNTTIKGTRMHQSLKKGIKYTYSKEISKQNDLATNSISRNSDHSR